MVEFGWTMSTCVFIFWKRTWKASMQQDNLNWLHLLFALHWIYLAILHMHTMCCQFQPPARSILQSANLKVWFLIFSDWLFLQFWQNVSFFVCCHFFFFLSQNFLLNFSHIPSSNPIFPQVWANSPVCMPPMWLQMSTCPLQSCVQSLLTGYAYK